jgi:glucose/arabinose dehydrogenase
MVTVPPQFTISQIATVPGARELAITPSGDLYVGTRGENVYVVRRAEDAHPQEARVYVQISDAPDSGVSYANGTLYVGTQHAVWRIENGRPVKLASVRAGEPPPGSDGDVHTTTSVAVDGDTVYASVGSSCNACTEIDPTRATVGRVENGKYVVIAKRIRNAIALAVDPQTHHLWVSNAGQDELPVGHPYEYFDDVSARKQPVDYGWPTCWEGHRCPGVAVPLVTFPAYETPIGAVFYPQHERGRYAFPAKYRGGAFITFHGSWHGPAQGLSGYMPPRVVFVALPHSRTWSEFIGGYQNGGTSDRIGRPTGITVGPQGDLFVADDMTGAIYRIRPK